MTLLLEDIWSQTFGNNYASLTKLITTRFNKGFNCDFVYEVKVIDWQVRYIYGM